MTLMGVGALGGTARHTGISQNKNEEFGVGFGVPIPNAGSACTIFWGLTLDGVTPLGVVWLYP